MKKSKIVHRLKLVLCAAATLLAASTQVQATTFGYTNGNVLLCFRKADPTTYNSLGGNDLVVNIGPIAYFTNLSANQKVTIANYTGTQLGQVATNSVGWSAWAFFDESLGATPNTLFMTRPRASLNIKTAPYAIKSHNSYGYVIGDLGSIVQGAMDNAANNYSTFSSSSAVLESDSWNEGEGSSLSYFSGLGATFDFYSSFQADPEQYTPANFTTSGKPLRSDFYWLYPSSAPNLKAIYLGYFELSTNGVMTYTAYPVDAPAIVSFTRNGTTSTVTFTTGTIGTYTLRGTNSLTSGTSKTNWPAISSVAGDGNNHSLSDVTASGNKFYIITAQ